MSLLFSPLNIKSITFKNRLVVSPMCQYSSKDGFANDWHLVHLGSRAIGGAGLIIQEATAVSEEGRITGGDAGIYKDDHIDMWSRIVSFIKQNGSVPGIQLAHAGRKASTTEPWNGGKQVIVSEGGWRAVAPSSIPYHEGDVAPVALDEEGILKVKDDFRSAALRAVKAGYQVIEIHAAHGYLLHEFLSPLSNIRTDNYGGSFNNRIRLILEITDIVKQITGDSLPLFVRISATDYAEGGWDEDDSVKLSQILKEKGADLIDCSSGGLVPKIKITTGAGYQVKFAEKIKLQADILTGAVGMITDAHHAESILLNKQADLVFMARQMLRDPYFPLHAAKKLNESINWPVQYDRAK